jgi:hypothetical protein
VRRTFSPWLAWPLLVAMVSARPVHAAPAPSLRTAEVPLAVEDPAGASDMSGETAENTAATREGPDPPPLADSVPETPRVPPPTAAIRDAEPERITIAVGLGPSAPGSKAENAVVDALERSARAPAPDSAAPATQVRRLRAGAGEGRAICRERRDDLVILLEYLPDRDEPVLVTRDCRLDRELAIRAREAASEPELVGVLWAEHRTLVRAGAKERKVRISRKVRTGLIAGGAILAVGLAIGLVLANSLRRETVVLTVGP